MKNNGSVQENTILQDLASTHDQLFAKIRKAKDDQHKTNQDIIDSTGVPDSNLDRLMRGEQTKPNAFYLAAICSDLGLSADELLGIPSPVGEALSAELSSLKSENLELRQQVKELTAELRHQREKAALLEKYSRSRRPLLFCLLALCLALAAALILCLVLG